MLRMDPVAGGDPPEIFAIGLRNPWRFSFDRQTGDLTDRRRRPERLRGGRLSRRRRAWRGAGANYGWPCFEGFHLNPNHSDSRCGTLTGDVKPVLERPHGSEVCSITGGYVVRDPGLPSLRGRYLYGDFCAPSLRSVNLADPRHGRRHRLGLQLGRVFGEDVCGRVYAASLDGPVSRIEDGAATPCAVDPPSAGQRSPGRRRRRRRPSPTRPARPCVRRSAGGAASSRGGGCGSRS